MNASLLSLNRNKWGSIRYQEAIRMVYTTLPVSGIGIQNPLLSFKSFTASPA